MKDEIKTLYKCDKELAHEVAATLGYKIVVAETNLGELVNNCYKILEQTAQTVEYNKGPVKKAQKLVEDFRKDIDKLLKTYLDKSSKLKK